MFLRQCPFCENVNPANSKFCNACGIRLHAALCPRCGAVNVVTARTCVGCAAELVETLQTSLCPECGAVNDAASTACVNCAAQLQPVVTPEASAAEARLPPPERPDLTEILVAPEHTSLEPAPVYSIHFGRDDSVKIDCGYNVDNVHVGAHPAAHALAVEPHPVTVQATETTAEARLALARFATQPAAQIIAPLFSESPRASVMPPPVVPRRLGAVLAATAVLALFAGSSYYLYREHANAQMSAVISSGDSKTRNGNRVTGMVADEVAGNNARTATNDATTSARAAPATRPAAPAARATTSNAGSVPVRQDDRLGPCTEAVAALGLCTPGTTQRRQ